MSIRSGDILSIMSKNGPVVFNKKIFKKSLGRKETSRFKNVSQILGRKFALNLIRSKATNVLNATGISVSTV